MLERRVYTLKQKRPNMSFLMIGRKLGISDSEARRHYDNAVDTLRKEAA